MGKVFAQSQQPGRRLRRCFEHKHAGQHRKLRKVVGQVLLGQRDVLDGRQLNVRLVRPDRIQQPKTHRFAFTRSASKPQLSIVRWSCVAIARLVRSALT